MLIIFVSLLLLPRLLEVVIDGCNHVLITVLQQLQKICYRRQLTLLMVSHNLDDAARIAERTFLVDDSSIYYDGSIQALLEGTAPEAKILGINKTVGVV